jgi:LDH2 family malate/lactate/ureidoglycolate dehydrogenase
MMIAINIGAFVDVNEYHDRIEKFRSGIKNSKRAEGFDEIFLPGEIELQKLKSATSISMPANVVAELNELAQEFGIEPLGCEIAPAKS